MQLSNAEVVRAGTILRWFIAGFGAIHPMQLGWAVWGIRMYPDTLRLKLATITGVALELAILSISAVCTRESLSALEPMSVYLCLFAILLGIVSAVC